MNGRHIYRYTSLPILLDMLVKTKITLIDPASWEDRNDSFFMEKYLEKKSLKTVLALCFTAKPETFHHWKVFAGNSGGVCVRFNDKRLLACFKNKRGIRNADVTYRRINDLKKNPPSVDELPFLKRIQYKDEAEFRIVYENKKVTSLKKDFRLDLQCIEKITLSPWLPPSVTETVKGVLRQIPGCESIKLIRTGVVEHSVWKNVANKLK